MVEEILSWQLPRLYAVASRFAGFIDGPLDIALHTFSLALAPLRAPGQEQIVGAVPILEP
jgi:hypothetical protein